MQKNSDKKLDESGQEANNADKANVYAKERYTSEVRATVLRVQHLIKYAAEAGKSIDKEIQQLLADFSRKVINGDGWTTAEEAAFWSATCRLSAELAPVTYDTLESSGVKAKKYVWFFGCLTLSLLAFLVYAQFAWVVLSNVTGTIEARYNENNNAKIKLEDLQLQRKALEIQLDKISRDIGETEAEMAQQSDRVRLLEESIQSNQKAISETELKLDDSQDQLAASMRILVGWLPFKGWLKTTRPPDPRFWDSRKEEQEKLKKIYEWENLHKEESMYRNKALHTWAEQILQGMSAYILPMIYGLVGACAFVLRSMSRQIRELTFSAADSTVQYMLRLVLGALAGISIGWFLKPDPSAKDLVSSISPLAIAFVAGYSVELLFTAMDKIITAFTGRGPGQPKAKAPG